MKDVLHFPYLRDNLLSVRKLSSASANIKFIRNKANRINNGKIIASVQLSENINKLKINLTMELFWLRTKIMELCGIDKARLVHIGVNGFKKLSKNTKLWSLVYSAECQYQKTTDQGEEYLSKEQRQWYKRKCVWQNENNIWSPNYPKRSPFSCVYIINCCPTRSLKIC